MKTAGSMQRGGGSTPSAGTALLSVSNRRVVRSLFFADKPCRSNFHHSRLSFAAMTHFEIDQGTREALTAERAEELLCNLSDGVTSAKLSGMSFGDGSASVAADALSRAARTLLRLDLSDIIASRPEEEAKRTLSIISDALSDCKHLIALDLSDNALGAKGIRAIRGLLAGQAELEELLLCNNGLAADAGSLITASVLETSPTNLVKLHFHNNLLETAGSVALAPIVENSPRLEDFRFSSLRLGREGTVRICEALRPRLTETLRCLNVSDNTFGEEGAHALTNALKNAPLLETLLLRDDALGDDGVKLVCEVLAVSAPKLKVLDISGNEMAVRGAKGLAKLLATGKMREVLAEDNELGSSGAVRLAKGIEEGGCLKILDVSSSEIGGRGALELATAVAKINNWKMLKMDGNAIPRDTVTAIEELLDDKLGPMDDNDDDGEEDEEEDDDGEDDEEEDGEEEADKADESEENKDDVVEAGKTPAVSTGKKSVEADVDELSATLGKISV